MGWDVSRRWLWWIRDLIMIPLGWHYVGYSVHDSLTLGGQYIVPKSLLSTLEVANPEQMKYNRSDDDSRLDRIREYLKALINVHLFFNAPLTCSLLRHISIMSQESPQFRVIGITSRYVTRRSKHGACWQLRS